jgi:hypothetical protein
MPRPGGPQPTIDSFSEEERGAYVRVYERFNDDPTYASALPGFFGTMLHSPRFAELLSAVGQRGRFVGDSSGSFSHADRELIDQVLCYDYDFYAFQDTHTPDAVSVGVRIEAIEAIRDGREADLTEDERLLVDFVRGVAGGTLTDKTFEAMEQRLGRRGVVEYTMFTAFVQLVIRLYQAFDIPGPGPAEVRSLVDGIKDGSVSLPDYRVNMR